MTRHKLEVKKGQKAQSKTAKTGSKVSETGSDAFAYAVGNVLQQVKDKDTGKKGFLGVKDEVLDPKEYSHSLVEENKK